MDLNFLQNEIKGRGKKMGIRPQTPAEMMLGVTEETGEVAKEVALFEKIGNKVNWKRLPDKNLLSEEISHLLVNIFSLASYYDISIEETMQKLFDERKK
jgi:NTP pyrophosphatase (non-canonical NTP hydrolase)